MATFTREVAPALRRVVSQCRDSEEAKHSSYNMPMLMAIKTPSFSFLFIIMPQMIVHGNKARMMSMAPEYAVATLA